MDPYSFVQTAEAIPDDYSAPGGAVGAAISSSQARAAQLELAQQREAQAQSQDTIKNTLAIHRSALDSAKDYYGLAKSLTDMQNETNQRLDAADFLTHFNNIHHTAPDYENQVATLSSQFPLALGDTAVQKTLAVKDAARKNYKDALQSGGAYEFEENSPAHAQFANVFQQTGDMNQARAAALAVKNGEEQVQKHITNGYLTPQDIYTDDTLSTVKPDLHDANGILNYTKLNDLAARRAGEVTGKPVLADERQVKEKLATIKQFADDDAMAPTVQALKQEVNDYYAKKAGKAPGDLTPTSKSVRNYLDF